MIEYTHDRSHVVTNVCALCGRPRGDGWESFADHLRGSHNPTDAGLSPIGSRPKPQPVPA